MRDDIQAPLEVLHVVRTGHGACAVDVFSGYVWCEREGEGTEGLLERVLYRGFKPRAIQYDPNVARDVRSERAQALLAGWDIPAREDTTGANAQVALLLDRWIRDAKRASKGNGMHMLWLNSQPRVVDGKHIDRGGTSDTPLKALRLHYRSYDQLSGGSS